MTGESLRSDRVWVPVVRAAEVLAAHVVGHELPEPAALTVVSRGGLAVVTVQLHTVSAPLVAGALLAWAQTLPAVTVEVWRPSGGASVQLSVEGTLTGAAGSVELGVSGAAWDGAWDDPLLFADLAPGQSRVVSLGRLRAWAAGRPGGTEAAGALGVSL